MSNGFKVPRACGPHCEGHPHFDGPVREFLLYDVHKLMWQRCYEPHHSWAERYRAARVQVTAPEWQCIRAFMAWGFGSGYAPGLTLERIDNDGHYCPANCRWATPVEQMANRGNTRFAPDGRPWAAVVRDAIAAAGSSVTTHQVLRRMFTSGWSLERAVSEPLVPRGPRRSRPG